MKLMSKPISFFYKNLWFYKKIEYLKIKLNTILI